MGREWVLAKTNVPLGERGAPKRTRANKWGGRGSKLGKLEWMYFSNVPLWNLTRFTFLVQKNSLWSEIPESIIPDWKVFSVEFVKIWSIRVEMLHGTRVGHLINCFKDSIYKIPSISIYHSMDGLILERWYFFRLECICRFASPTITIRTLHLHNL